MFTTNLSYINNIVNSVEEYPLDSQELYAEIAKFTINKCYLKNYILYNDIMSRNFHIPNENKEQFEKNLYESIICFFEAKKNIYEDDIFNNYISITRKILVQCKKNFPEKILYLYNLKTCRLRYVYETAYILYSYIYLSRNKLLDNIIDQYILTREQLLNKFDQHSEFPLKKIDNIYELNTLIEYHNLMIFLINITPNHSYKLKHFCDMVSILLESKIYKSGSGKTESTERRETIYRVLSNCPKIKRPEQSLLRKMTLKCKRKRNFLYNSDDSDEEFYEYSKNQCEPVILSTDNSVFSISDIDSFTIDLQNL